MSDWPTRRVNTRVLIMHSFNILQWVKDNARAEELIDNMSADELKFYLNAFDPELFRYEPYVMNQTYMSPMCDDVDMLRINLKRVIIYEYKKYETLRRKLKKNNRFHEYHERALRGDIEDITKWSRFKLREYLRVHSPNLRGRSIMDIMNLRYYVWRHMWLAANNLRI